MKQILLLSILLLTLPQLTHAQYPKPTIVGSGGLGRNIQRTINLLENSTLSQKNTVKILVYGQSISEQEWSDSIKLFLTNKYPNANIIMINRAIGAFASQLLKKPMWFDINPFQPDLVIFHVYGSSIDLDSVIYNIRKNTNAEVLFQNAHVTFNDSLPNSWENTYGYNRIPLIAQKYGCEFADVRTNWYNYLKVNKIRANSLTKDGTHLNTHGNYLMANILKAYFNKLPNIPSDEHNTIRTLNVGTDIDWGANNELNLTFVGSKIEVVMASANQNQVNDFTNVEIDGMNPRSIIGTHFVLRPSVPYNFTWKNGWPWNVAGPIKIVKAGTPLENEIWTLTITSYNVSGNTKNISFALGGSKTGFDGTGSMTYTNNQPSGPLFTSISKKIAINGADWFTYLDISNPYAVGQKINFETRIFANDIIKPAVDINSPIDSVVVLAQGLANKVHTLRLTSLQASITPIKSIRIYSPILERQSGSPISAPVLVSPKPVYEFCKGDSANLSSIISDINSIPGEILFYRTSVANKIYAPYITTLSGSYIAYKTNYNGGESTVNFQVTFSNCQPKLEATNLGDTIPCYHLPQNLYKRVVDKNATSGFYRFSYDSLQNQLINYPNSFVGNTFYAHKVCTVSGLSDFIKVKIKTAVCISDLKIVGTLTGCAPFDLTLTVADSSGAPGYISFLTDVENNLFVEEPANVLESGVYYARFDSDSGFQQVIPLNIVIKSASECITSSSNRLNKDIKIYPNPSIDFVNIDLENDQIISYNIKDLLGKSLFSKSNIHLSSCSLDLSSLPLGNYFIEILSKKGLFYHKIVKQ